MISSTGILTIDLPAIQSNWRYVLTHLTNGCDCAAVVKADAYGVGANEVVDALYKGGCRNFFVVTMDEALDLRLFLPKDAALYVLGGVRPGYEDTCVENGLIPVLFSLSAIEQWLDFCQQVGEALPCAIKMDSGMTRLGLSQQELESFWNNLSNHPLLNPLIFMSHLACADEPTHPLNRIQLDSFRLALARMRLRFPAIKASLANSSGSFLGSDFHFDMVRIGAALYGINPQPLQTNPLRLAISLKLRVQQVRDISAEVSVGYGAGVKVSAGARLAVVSGGYADGVHRTLGSNPRGEINGQIVHSVGRISMDSCVFDVSALQGPFPGYVEVINQKLNLDYLISNNKSLGYEVLTSLGKRYRRHYLPVSETSNA